MQLFKTKKQVISFIILFLYSLFHLYLVTKHEAWRDEAQAYLLVRNLSFGELFRVLSVEGHPILWFVFLIPFVKLGIPFRYFSYYSLIIMMISAFIFLKKSPFPIYVNFISLCGISFVYYNPVICRVYGLIVLFTVLILALYSERDKHPILYMLLVSLLMQTHVKVYGLAFGFCLDFFIEYIKKDKRKIKWLALPTLSTLLVFIELLPYGEYKPYVAVESYRFFYRLGITILNEYSKQFRVLFGIMNSWLILLITVFIIITIGLIVYRFFINKKKIELIEVALCAACGFGGYFVVSAFVYSSHTQMATILADIFLAIIWIIYLKGDTDIKKLSSLVLAVCCILSLPLTIRDLSADIKSPYSNGLATAEYIDSQIEDESIIVLEYHAYNPLIYSYVVSDGKQIHFYDLSNERWYSFHQWSETHKKLTCSEILEQVSKKFKGKKVYYLSTEPVEEEKFDLVYSNLDDYSIKGENYCIYKIEY